MVNKMLCVFLVITVIQKGLFQNQFNKPLYSLKMVDLENIHLFFVSLGILSGPHFWFLLFLTSLALLNCC